jgi:hypothetical protein
MKIEKNLIFLFFLKGNTVDHKNLIADIFCPAFPTTLF